MATEPMSDRGSTIEDPQLRIGTSSAGGITEVVLVGELDAHTVTSFMNDLRAAVSTSDQVEIDAAKLTFVDSSGLRALIAVTQEAEKSGRSVRLRTVSPQLLRLLELTGLQDLLPH